MYRLTLTEAQSQAAVKAYRTANAAVPALWKAYELAAVAAVKHPHKIYRAGKCVFGMDGKFLFIQLPSERRLRYLSPRIGHKETIYGPTESLEFLGVAPDKKTMRWERTWGGTLTENIVQAVARDLLMHGQLQLKKAGYRVLMGVHDESICEAPIGQKNIEEFSKMLCSRPKWVDDELPLEAKAWQGPRYRK